MSKEFRNVTFSAPIALFMVATSWASLTMADVATQTFGQALTEQKSTPARQTTGDSFRMPAPGAMAKNIATPARGSSKEAVLAQFGEPGSREPAVGEPPISVWHYSEFSVFFEHNLTLHSVLTSQALSTP